MKEETNSENKKITISKVRFDNLIKAERKLNQLEANGVKKWSGYGCMCCEGEEMSCVFCESDK